MVMLAMVFSLVIEKSDFIVIIDCTAGKLDEISKLSFKDFIQDENRKCAPKQVRNA
jgi:hypothetical protein